MTISALPTPPNRNMTPDAFVAAADAFVAALSTFATQVNNDLSLILNAAGLVATSTTSLTVGTGSKSLTVQADKSFLATMTVRVYDTATPTNWMTGTVTSYNATTGALVVNVTATNGSGTVAAWTVALQAAGEWVGNAATATTATNAGTSGSFSLPVTGISGVSSVTADYLINNGYVHLHLPPISGTSNSVQFFLGNLPVGLRPAADRYLPVLWGADNGVDIATVRAYINSTGAVILYKDGTGGSSWTASGTKSLHSSEITYKL